MTLSVPHSSADVAPPRLAVVIVNYNSSLLLERCIASLPRKAVTTIVVVDNHSTVEQVALLRVIAQRDVRVDLVEVIENRGFGAGVNIGVARLAPAPDDLFVVLNPDTVIHPGALEVIGTHLARNDCDIVSPTIVSGDPEQPRVWYRGGWIDYRRGSAVHCDYGRAHNQGGGMRRADFVTGACLAMTGAAWKTLGGFREDLFLYWEDTDLSIRAAAAGLRMAVQLDASIWHAEGGSEAGPGRSRHYFYYMQCNRLRILAPHVGVGALLFWPGGPEALRLLGRALRERTERWSKLWAGVRGIVAGLAQVRSPLPPQVVSCDVPSRMAQYYVTVRTAHLERANRTDSPALCYAKRSYDCDPAALLRTGAIRMTPFGFYRYAIRSRFTVLEINEPAMISAWPALLVLAVLARIDYRLRRSGAPALVCYAIENLDPALALSAKLHLPVGWPGSSRRASCALSGRR